MANKPLSSDRIDKSLVRLREDHLPFSKRAHGRCDALDQDGRRCPKKAYRALSFHGDSETRAFDDDRARWVRIEFCRAHWEAEA